MADIVNITLGGRRLRAEVAGSVIAQRRGLQGHPPLRDDEAMFFPYPRTHEAHFHMGTVRFPIDILFLSKVGECEYRVGKVARDIQPGDPSIFSYPMTDAVLETRGGLSQGLGLGDHVTVEGRGGVLSYTRRPVLGFRRVAELGVADTIEDGSTPGGVDMPGPGNGRRSKHLDLAVGRPVNDSKVRGGPLNRGMPALEAALRILGQEDWQRTSRTLLAAVEGSATWAWFGDELAQQAAARAQQSHTADVENQVRGLYRAVIALENPLFTGMDPTAMQIAGQQLKADSDTQDRLGRVLRQHIDGAQVRVNLAHAAPTAQEVFTAEYEGINQLDQNGLTVSVRLV